MFHLFTPSKYWAILALIVLGIASHGQAMAAPPEPIQTTKPELINLYFAELNRSHCDHLVVAVLQESKEGVVVDMFPPGNDGSEKSKNGHVVDMFPPGNDGTRPKSTGGTGSGDMKSGAVDHNTTRSNRGGIRDTGGTGGDKGEIGHHGVGNKAELSEAMASRSDLSQADPKRALEPITTNVYSTRKKADRVALVGFGSFSRSARTGRNPQTGAVITLEDLKQGHGIGSGDSKPGGVSYSSSRSNRPSSIDTGGGTGDS
ncbi:MAG: HU family DNA-binding protein, partial [Rubripirellula sp.]|nr:HU family DNA-binding protein [Rubripirellula sp.]